MYRDANVTIHCPRCRQPLPDGDVACCSAGCGVWVPAAIAATALDPAERAYNRVIGWWRPLAACPFCTEAMTRRGQDMVPLLGCDEHGFWIDDENVGQTRIARTPLLDDARKAARRVMEAKQEEAERAREIERAERARMFTHENALRAEREAALRAEAERRAARERAAQPYLDLVSQAVRDGDLLPLAEQLQKLEQAIQALTHALQTKR